jgi:gentisate 1,2-dioxygenase
LSYSNAALLERLNIHFVDEHPPEDEHGASHERDEASESREIEDIIPLSLDGASLMRYEGLINPAVVEQPVLHWPWRAVRPELDKLADLGADYRGRRLYLLYNPASGRTNGTTNSFFATITVRPPRIVDPPHRHSAAAINYYLSGSGYSRVDGERLEWKAGDLMFSAPGWATHNHASNDEVVYELTVQDTPFNLAIDSLMWQEDLTRPPILLGSHRGFMTNRASVDPTTVFPGRHQ